MEGAIAAPQTSLRVASLRAVAERRFVAALVLIGALCGLVAAVSARHSGFVNDDFENLSKAHFDGLTPGFLTDPIIGERLSPGHRLLDWIVVQVPEHMWTVALVLTAVWLVATVVSAGILARQLTGSAVAGLLVAVLVGTWAGWMRVALWWAASAHLLPGTALSFVALSFAVRWDRTRRTRDLVWSAVALLAAVMFAARPVIVPLIALVILVVATPATRSITWRGTFDRLRSTAAALALLFAVAIGYQVVDIIGGDAPGAGFASATEWWSLAWHWLVGGDGPLAINGSPTGGALTLAAGAGTAVLVAVAAATIRGSRSAWIWVSAVLLLVACGLQVGVSRLAQVGLFIVGELRYHEGDVLVLAALVPCAWVAAGRPVPRTSLQRGVVGGLAVVFAITWVAVGYTTQRDARARDAGPVARAYVDNLRATLPTTAAPVPPTVVNLHMPVERSANGPTDLRRVIPTFARAANVTFVQPNGAPLLVWNDGIVHPLAGGPSVPGPLDGDGCLKTTKASGYLEAGAASQAITALPPTTVRNPLRLLRLRFRDTQAPGRLAVVFQPTAHGLPDLELSVTAATAGLQVAIPADSTAVSFVAWSGLDTCITAVRIVPVHVTH